MTNKQLQQRIEELERRVRDLEARPVYVPQPLIWPPQWPQQPMWKVTIGDHTGCAPLNGNHQNWSAIAGMVKS